MDGPIPAILTDSWAIWVIDKLTSNGETALSDADIAAIINNPTSNSRAVLNSMLDAARDMTADEAKVYTDTVASALNTTIGGSIASGDIQSVSFAKDYTDRQVAATLQAAKDYADSHSGTGGVSQAYVDAGDYDTLVEAGGLANTAASAAEARAKSYADGKATDAKNVANGYTDLKLVDYVADVDLNSALTLVRQDASNDANAKDLVVQENANAYTDQQIAAIEIPDNPNEVTQADLTAGIEQANTFTRSAVDELHTTVSGEIDTRAQALSTGILGAVDGKDTAILDLAIQADAEVLTQAKAYSDETAAEAGAVTPGYVDAGDTNTLAAAKNYTDTKSTDALTQSKNYTDGKGFYTVPATGIPKANLASEVTLSLARADSALQPEDPEWTPVAVTGSWSGSSISYLIRGGFVKLRGLLQKNATLAAGATENAVATLPVAIRPTALEAFPGVTGGGVGTFVINANGSINVTMVGTASSYIRLNAAVYPLD